VGSAAAGLLHGHPGVHARGDRVIARYDRLRLVWDARVEVWFRAAAGREPDVLEIGARGRRRPRVEAYWDGCLIAL